MVCYDVTLCSVISSEMAWLEEQSSPNQKFGLVVLPLFTCHVFLSKTLNLKLLAVECQQLLWLQPSLMCEWLNMMTRVKHFESCLCSCNALYWWSPFTFSFSTKGYFGKLIVTGFQEFLYCGAEYISYFTGSNHLQTNNKTIPKGSQF